MPGIEKMHSFLIFFEHGYQSDYCTYMFPFLHTILDIYMEGKMSQTLCIGYSLYIF